MSAVSLLCARQPKKNHCLSHNSILSPFIPSHSSSLFLLVLLINSLIRFLSLSIFRVHLSVSLLSVSLAPCVGLFVCLSTSTSYDKATSMSEPITTENRGWTLYYPAASRILPELMKEGRHDINKDDALHSINREFASWPEHCPTPTMVLYHPRRYEDNTILAGGAFRVSFHWTVDRDVLGHEKELYYEVAALEKDTVEAKKRAPMTLVNQSDATGCTSEVQPDKPGAASVVNKKRRRVEEAQDEHSGMTALKRPARTADRTWEGTDIIEVVARHLVKWLDDNNMHLRKYWGRSYEFTDKQMDVIAHMFLRARPFRWSPPACVEWESDHDAFYDHEQYYNGGVNDDKDNDLLRGVLVLDWNSPAGNADKCGDGAEVLVETQLDKNGVKWLLLDVRVDSQLEGKKRDRKQICMSC